MNRKGSVLLTMLAMAVSIFVMLGVEHVREQAKNSFSNTVSGVDLVVGARTGNINLLLYSIFRMGAPTNNISWQSYQDIQNDRKVAWTIPISLGDSHKGYRVIGTNSDYFTHYHYGQKQPLGFEHGQAFKQVFDVVLGYEVAKALNYQLGDKLVLSHGVGATSFTHHDENPFTVVGILKPTGTPVDQSLHVSLQGLEALHYANLKLAPEGDKKRHIQLEQLANIQPKSITAFMVGLKSKMAVFQIQRRINNAKSEPLMAILPGVALSELWQSMAVMENALRLISVLVFISALLGLSAMLLTSIRERYQEIHLLRAIGASPLFLFWFIELEAMLITIVSTALGASALYGTLVLAQDYILTHYGVSLDTTIVSADMLPILGVVYLFTFIAAIPPAVNAFNKAR
ncbi:ABC transporter permease [Thalassotalea euphylliae]|uniref:ABC transporter permease n=1 Tax=Thalassotalea euphylliae TaxID=1655234 RepID=UPI00362C25CA